MVGGSVDRAVWKGDLALFIKIRNYFDSAVLLLEIEFIEIKAQVC